MADEPVNDLVVWYSAQLDADERLIKRNAGQKGITDDGIFPDHRTYDGENLDAADAYLAEFNPKRMLREVEAKRRVLSLYEQAQRRAAEPSARWSEQLMRSYPVRALLDVVKLLALLYADREGYREEWRPSPARPPRCCHPNADREGCR